MSINRHLRIDLVKFVFVRYMCNDIEKCSAEDGEGVYERLNHEPLFHGRVFNFLRCDVQIKVLPNQSHYEYLNCEQYYVVNTIPLKSTKNGKDKNSTRKNFTSQS